MNLHGLYQLTFFIPVWKGILTKAASGPLATPVAICTRPTKERLTTILGPNTEQKRPESLHTMLTCDLFHLFMNMGGGGGGVAQMVLELSFGHGLSRYDLADDGQRGELGA